MRLASERPVFFSLARKICSTDQSGRISARFLTFSVRACGVSPGAALANSTDCLSPSL